MKEYIYLTVFAVGLLWNIIARFSFERKKGKFDKKYISLYKEYNTFLIILFLALCIDKASIVFDFDKLFK